MKKSLTSFLISAIVISTALLSAACSQNTNASNGPTDPKPTTKKPDPLYISVFSLQNEEEPSDSNKTYKWMKDNFGVTFEWDILSTPEEKASYIQTLIMTGDLPDLVEVDSTAFYEAGTLRDLKPLIEEYCPNLKKHYASVWDKMAFINGEKNSNGTFVKGHIYSLPNSGVLDGIEINTGYSDYAWWVQKRVLKEYSYPKIKTIDEYFDLLENYYKKYPITNGMPTIPFSIITNDLDNYNLLLASGLLAGFPNEGYGYVENSTFTSSFADDNTERWLKLANGYYTKGLIDSSSFTDNRSQYLQKIADGRVLGMFIKGSDFQSIADKNLPDEETYVPLPITFDETIKPVYKTKAVPNLQKGYGITVKCSQNKAIKILQFMDEMLNEENQKILYWGFEGIDYALNSGIPNQTLQQYNNWINNTKATLWANEAPKLEGLLSSGYCNSISGISDNYQKYLSSLDKELLASYGVSSYAELVTSKDSENKVCYPLQQCYPFEGYYRQVMIDCENAMSKHFPKLIMGSPDDFEKNWTKYNSDIEEASNIFEIYMQYQLDQWINEFGSN